MTRYGVGGSRKSLHLAVSQSFVAILFVLVDFIFSKQLSVAQFGLWKEVFFIFNLGIPLITFGLPEGYKYFIAKNKDYSGYYKSLTRVLFLLALFIFFISIVINGLHYFEFINIGPYYLISLLLPLPLLSFVTNKSLRYTYINLDKTEFLTKLSFYGAIVSLIIIVICLFLFETTNGYFLAIPIVVYSAIFGVPSFFYYKELPFTTESANVSKVKVFEMLHYGFPLYLATFMGLINGYLDKLIVNIFEDEVTFAIFSVGAFEIPIFAMLSAAFSQQIFPSMVANVEEGNEIKAKSIWINTTKKVSLLTYPVLLLCMFFAEEIIFFIYSEAYSGSVILFKTYLLVALFRNNSYGILLTAKGENKVITKIAVLMLLLNGVLSILLYYYLGIKGIVFGSLFSSLFFVTIILSKEKIWKQYINKVFLNPIIGGLTILIILAYLL
jgi:O-antigen/teichoic acid export membrane protein